MVNNLLDFNRSRSGKRVFHKRSIDPGKYILRVTDRIQKRVASGGYVIETNVPEDVPQVEADPDAFEQALTNLVDNAVKYSQKAGKITVSAQVKDCSLRIHVQDQGIGISEHETQKIFNQFYRGENSRSGKQYGSGLGLTLVKQILEAHQGTVELSSEPGKGSCFTLNFPLNTQEKRKKDG
jgi:signal transduction histidine kinase